jgi:hypothetical protein
MDGVLYNFDKLFAEAMPGVDMENDDEWSWEELHRVCPNIYLDGQAMPGIKEVFYYAGSLGENYALTAVPRRWPWPNVTRHKRTWMWSNFGMPLERIRFGPYAEDKQYHVLYSDDVLIDDRIRNIEQWRARGGIGIHHINPEETLNQIKRLEYGV